MHLAHRPRRRDAQPASTESHASRAAPSFLRLLRHLGSSSLVALAALSPSIARAEGDAFQRGKELLDRGLLTEACEMLTKADHDKPSVGTIGLLAACHEKQGRTATAWREYQETAHRAAAAHDDRERFALDRIAKLEPLVPRLLVHVPRREKLAVTLGGRALDPATLSAAVRVDPGPVEIVASNDGGKRWSVTVALEPSEERVVEIPSLAEPAIESAPRRSGAPPWPALVAGGVGVAGVGVVTGFGISAMVQNAHSVTIESRCKAGTATPSECTQGRDERARARTFGNVATVGLAVGAAGLGTAAVLWILDVGGSHGSKTAPNKASTTIHVAPTGSEQGAGLGVWGSF